MNLRVRSVTGWSDILIDVRIYRSELSAIDSRDKCRKELVVEVSLSMKS